MTPQHERRLSLLLISIGATLLAVETVTAAEPTPRPADVPNSAPAVDQQGPTIKNVYKNHFLIGMAGDLPGYYSDQEIGLVKESFNIVTPENCMKPAPVHPSENAWRFQRRDALVQ